MPEYIELYASYWLVNHFIHSVQPECHLVLRAIIIDATDPEQACSPSHLLVCKGFPYPFAQGAKVPQGSRGSQNNIYPPISCNIPDTHLKLKDMHFHSRSLILHFTSSSEDASVTREWWMQVQMLTHTIIQVYAVLDFHERICKVPKKACRFRVAMALDLGEYVMVFLLLDNMFGVWYSQTQSLLTTYLLALECIQLQRYFTVQVYAKDCTWLPTHHQTQYDELRQCLDSSIQEEEAPIVHSVENGWFDPYEPLLIAAGLEKAKNLGHIIYEKASWVAGGGRVWEDCPLDVYNIMPTEYVYLLPLKYFSSLLKSWTNCYLYNTDHKSFWCTMGNLPANTLPYSRQSVEVEQPCVTIVLPDQQKKELFENIVLYRKGYAVGPLDYCGIAQIHCKKVAIYFFKMLLEASFDRRRHLKIGKQKTTNLQAAKQKQASQEAKENIPEHSLSYDTTCMV
ncbi:hypothetical protein BDN71DRAFT_1553085 [Pleurotus eryngii]|uniref:Uncharacterized protein n=1 Tax=Pleurotus eryngii TaxID=5323 RepID=A0A9P5ZER9_PLEER|nr:hypothetical protein BDN71DRAFT_1553085 [Pleurotus eryngii]